MASTTFPNSSIYSLDSMDMEAGSNQELTFTITSGSSPVNLNASTYSWWLAPFGSQTAVVTKTASISGAVSSFTVALNNSDTSNLSGKYVQAYQVVLASGSYLKPGRGIVTILGGIS
jgi:hypothetical protein